MEEREALLKRCRKIAGLVSEKEREEAGDLLDRVIQAVMDQYDRKQQPERLNHDQ